MKRFRLKHQGLTLTLTLTAMLGGTSAFLAGDEVNNDRNNQFEFALIGDAPYAPTVGVSPNKTQVYPAPEYDALIADINNHNKVLFTIHVGDIKAGDTWCIGGTPAKGPSGAADIYKTNLTLFNNYRNGVVLAPGDNEWTDCHRTNNGAYNPQERLAYLRSIFYTSNHSLGQRPFTLTRQSSDPGFELYKENVMWRAGGIIFVAINQPGSNNNHNRNIANSSPTPADDNEAVYTARNTANIAWINKAFDLATSDSSTKGVLIAQQANVFERFLEPSQGYTRSGYEAFVIALRNRTVAFGKPVVLVGGDTHTVRVDKPMTLLYPGHCTTVNTTCVLQAPTATSSPIYTSAVVSDRVQNFTRVEVYGSPDTHWVRVVVDPGDPNLFLFSLQSVAGNGHGNGQGRDDEEEHGNQQ